jgi:hypothetical protein
MNFTIEQIPADQHKAPAERAARMSSKGKISVDFDAPAGLIGTQTRKCKPTINKDGSVTVQAFRGTWQAIPVQVLWDGKPAIVRWESKHIHWND